MTESLEANLTDSESDTDNSLDDAAWSRTRPVQLLHYWSGELAPPKHHAEARALWTAGALFVRFDCQQHEPLIVNSEPQTAQKTIGLWERDVCEIFIAPDPNEPSQYYEFEAAPTGEWLDIAIHQKPDKRETDWEYSSGMTVATQVDNKRFAVVMRIPFEAFGGVPQTGERWRTNLFRCVGAGEARGYLAWQPTRTEQPNFHVPESFGWLCFTG